MKFKSKLSIVFDVATPITPVSVVVQEETSVVPSLDSDSISTTVLAVILLGFTIIAGVSVFFLLRKGKDKNTLKTGLVLSK